MKTHYSDYVKHVARFWLKYRQRPERFESKADKDNWWLFDSVIREYDMKSQELLINFYESNKVDDRYMGLVRRFERDFAKRRGLI